MPKVHQRPKGYCFVSYSTREPHNQILIECLKIAFHPHFELRFTPSALASGTSQLKQITDLIRECAFAVVSIDGLRPNVVFEYGLIEGIGKPAILLREQQSRVDILSFYGNAAQLTIAEVPFNPDSHFSDVKDLYYATWSRYAIKETVELIHDQYDKMRHKITDDVNIPKRELW